MCCGIDREDGRPLCSLQSDDVMMMYLDDCYYGNPAEMSRLAMS